MDDEVVTKLYRVRKTVLQMLNDRGYLVLDEELSQTKDDFREKFGDDPKKDDLTMSKKKSDGGEQVGLIEQCWLRLMYYSEMCFRGIV